MMPVAVGTAFRNSTARSRSLNDSGFSLLESLSKNTSSLRVRLQPTVSTLSPRGVAGHLSRLSGTPSPSPSSSQPDASTGAPAGVPGQRSILSVTPSPSLSAGAGGGGAGNGGACSARQVLPPQ